MNAIAKILVQKAAEARSEAEPNAFVTVALFCAIGLLASLCLAIYGPDLDLGTMIGFY